MSVKLDESSVHKHQTEYSSTSDELIGTYVTLSTGRSNSITKYAPYFNLKSFSMVLSLSINPSKRMVRIVLRHRDGTEMTWEMSLDNLQELSSLNQIWVVALNFSPNFSGSAGNPELLLQKAVQSLLLMVNHVEV